MPSLTGPAMAYAPMMAPRMNDFSVNSLLSQPHFFPSMFRGPAGLGSGVPSFLPKLGDPHNPYVTPDFLAAHLHHRHPMQMPAPLPGLEPSEGDTDDPQVNLESKDLWEQFHERGTEMVITKSGRWAIMFRRCFYCFFVDIFYTHYYVQCFMYIFLSWLCV